MWISHIKYIKKSTIKDGANLVGLQGPEPCDLIKALKWAFIPKIKCRTRKSFDRSELLCPLWGGKSERLFIFVMNVMSPKNCYELFITGMWIPDIM